MGFDGLTRRQFLIAGGALAGAAIAGVRPERPALANTGALDEYILTVGYSERELAGYRLRTRTYNASIPGPLLVTGPGRRLRVTIANRLPPNPPAKAPQGIDPENNPARFNTTNLHVHGLQVTPHLFAPIGTGNPVAPLIAIESGQSLIYDFQLPPDHPSGLYWYHPHFHGSAGVQVTNGMAGLILVKGPIDEVPEIAAARDELLAIQNLKINPDGGGRWSWDPIAYKPPGEGGYAFSTQMELLTANGQPIMAIDRRGPRPVAKRMALPEYRMRPGEVMRLRVLNGTDGIFLPLVLRGFEMYLIGQDGINLPVPLRAGSDGKTALRMAPGNRVEVLIRAPNRPTSAVLTAMPQMAASPMMLSEWMGEILAAPAIGLARLVVSGQPRTMEIPAKLPLPTREYPAIRDDEIVARRTVTFEGMKGSKRILTGWEFLIDGRLYAVDRIDARVTLGTAEEWTIVNKSDGIHPFHIHVNSFEVIGMPGDPGYRRLHDTIWVAPFSRLKIRMRFKTWKGKSVYHCHVLPHEDSAMITNFIIA